MRTHTALHILCGVILRDYGASVTGGNMEPLQGPAWTSSSRPCTRSWCARSRPRSTPRWRPRRDCACKILPRDEAFQIPDLIRTKINLLPPGIPEVRTVEIVGLDLQADGGTHVANTREVGRIRDRGLQEQGEDQQAD